MNEQMDGRMDGWLSSLSSPPAGLHCPMTSLLCLSLCLMKSNIKASLLEKESNVVPRCQPNYVLIQRVNQAAVVWLHPWDLRRGNGMADRDKEKVVLGGKRKKRDLVRKQPEIRCGIMRRDDLNWKGAVAAQKAIWTKFLFCMLSRLKAHKQRITNINTYKYETAETVLDTFCHRIIFQLK